jgi:hypothetical protein
LCEAHLAAYNGTTGRHSRTVPGGGLAESWGIRETDTTSSHHLRFSQGKTGETAAMSEDMKKALRDFGAAGGRFFPIELENGTLVWGAHRYAELEGTGLEPLGRFDKRTPCVARKRIGKGTVFYAGTNFGQAVERDAGGLQALLSLAADAAGIGSSAGLVPELPGTVHVDLLGTPKGLRFAVINCSADRAQTVKMTLPHGIWRGLFTGVRWTVGSQTSVTVPPGFRELFIAE